ncbi:ribosomal protein S18-alanine N-acetyltransferase [soil metagenome]
MIRRARESDLGAVLEIEGVSFADPWNLESFEMALDLARMLFLVAEETDESGRDGAGGQHAAVVGYVIALLLLDEAEVADLAVLPRVRGRGIGGRLLDQVSVEVGALGVRSLYLEVRESNASARALYESRSFAHVGRRRGYYQHPREDALLMRREIDGG